MLRTPASVREMLHILEYRLTDRLDFAKMKLQPTSLIPRDFRHIETDMIWTAPFRIGAKGSRKTVTIYLLIEHQSEPDGLITFRVLEYVVHMLRTQLRAWKRKHGSTTNFRFQPIVPIVLYTGTRPWSEIPPLGTLFLANEEFSDILPTVKPLFLNIGVIRNELLQDPKEMFAWVIRLLRNCDTDSREFAGLTSQILAVGDQISEIEKLRWRDLLTYLHSFVYHYREPNEGARLQELIEDAASAHGFQAEIHAMKMTMAEKHRKEGRKKGREEGREEGQLETKRADLLSLLSERFGELAPEIVERIEAEKDFDILDNWFKRGINARNLNQVGIA
jgi:hypothetical protein